MSALLVPTFTRYVKAWPGASAPRVEYLPLGTALTRRFDDDRHFAAYSVPTVQYRMASPALGMLAAITMTLALFDIDAPGHTTPSGDWRDALLAAVAKIRSAGLAIFYYETKNGGRLVARRDPPIILRSSEDAETWRRRYRADLGELARFGIAADSSPVITAWTCLFRLPHVRREGRIEERRTLGDPHHVGRWTFEPTAAELAPPPPPPAVPVATPSPSSSPYADAALGAELERVRAAAGGTIFNTVNRAAFSLGCLVATGALDSTVVADALLAAAEAAARAADKLSVAGRRDAIGTIKRAIAAAAAKHPRTVPAPKLSCRPTEHHDDEAPHWLRARTS